MAPKLRPPSRPPQLRRLGSDETISSLSSLPHDIIQSHILPRLDGATLAALGCVSSRFNSLCSSQHIWRDICCATWPSVRDPRLDQIISSFPSGYRSFFSSSFPLLHHTDPGGSSSTSAPARIISAVDIYYRGTAVLSQVQDTVTTTRWFNRSVFRVYLLDPMETYPTAVTYEGPDDGFIEYLESHLTLSWIIIDPTRKRAVNVSSRRTVSARPFVLNDVELRFATVVGAGVKCEAVVTCVRRKGCGMHVREIRLEMVDMEMEGRELTGRDSLVILESVLEEGRRERGEGRERHGEFDRRRKERQQRRERWRCALEILGVSVIVAVASLLMLSTRAILQYSQLLFHPLEAWMAHFFYCGCVVLSIGSASRLSAITLEQNAMYGLRDSSIRQCLVVMEKEEPYCS